MNISINRDHDDNDFRYVPPPFAVVRRFLLGLCATDAEKYYASSWHQGDYPTQDG